MRTAVIGDIHGRPDWKEIVNKEPWDAVVFLGDYFDTHENTTAEEQTTNFREIVEYKRANPDKVTLLIGNHDYHYIVPGQYYSGHQAYAAKEIGETLRRAEDVLVVAAEAQGWLCTHAGVTKTWALRYAITPLAEDVNTLWKSEPERGAFGYDFRDRSGYGESIIQGPLWVRPASLFSDMAVEKQIVGHTRQKDVTLVPPDEPTLILADCLGTSRTVVNANQFVIINDGVIEVGRY